MVTLYTIGFTKKTLEAFLSLLKENKITKVVDIRRNRNSQLSGFAKERDLQYILETFLGIKYEVNEELAPPEGLLKDYQKNKDWEKYELAFNQLIKDRKLEKFKESILTDKERICFLCSESEASKCHRRLISEFFKSLGNNISIKHL